MVEVVLWSLSAGEFGRWRRVFRGQEGVRSTAGCADPVFLVRSGVSDMLLRPRRVGTLVGGPAARLSGHPFVLYSVTFPCGYYLVRACCSARRHRRKLVPVGAGQQDAASDACERGEVSCSV